MINWEVNILSYFKLREAKCQGWEFGHRHDCGLVILYWDLLYALYLTRDEFGKPIIVRSWTRCRPHNLAIGGEDDSYHQNGHAIDITCEDKFFLDELEMIARKYFDYVERHSWGLHCDIRGERPCVK